MNYSFHCFAIIQNPLTCNKIYNNTAKKASKTGFNILLFFFSKVRLFFPLRLIFQNVFFLPNGFVKEEY